MTQTSDSADPEPTGVCGIVMPIAAMGEAYPEEHWRRVKRILQTAIERAGLQPKVVWENPEIDVIQSAILKNIYENDVVICDVSGLNPNVMLETGLRLSTKRPTIIVTDKIQKPPFDISNFAYIDYQKDLEYNSIEKFIGELADKISTVFKSFKDSTYKSFVEQFKFETVTPETVNVSTEEYIRDQLSQLQTSIRRLESREIYRPRVPPSSLRNRSPVFRLSANLTEEYAKIAERRIDDLDGFEYCSVERDENGRYVFRVPMSDGSPHSREQALAILKAILDEAESDSIPF